MHDFSDVSGLNVDDGLDKEINSEEIKCCELKDRLETRVNCQFVQER